MKRFEGVKRSKHWKFLTPLSLILIAGLSLAVIAGGGILLSGKNNDNDAATSDTWANYTEAFDTSHAGTEDDPYLIETAGQLAYLIMASGSYRYKYFKQTADIMLGAHEWATPQMSYFQAHYDGNGYTIYGIRVNQPTLDYQSLFGRINAMNNPDDSWDYTTIKNVTMKGGYVIGESNVAALVGEIAYSAGNGVTIKNCVTDVRVYAANTYAGGIIGSSANFGGHLEISDCINYGSIIADTSVEGHVTTYGGSGVGGICGDMRCSSCWITDCVNHGLLKGYTNVGGIVGQVDQSGASCSIETCISDGDIIADSGVGGILGAASMSAKAYIMFCFATGYIEASGNVNRPAKGGALVGTDVVGVLVQMSYFIGTSNVAKLPLLGGVVGNASPHFDVCYSICNDYKIRTNANSGWGHNYRIVENINNGLPITIELFPVADAAPEEKDAVWIEWFSANNFIEVDDDTLQEL